MAFAFALEPVLRLHRRVEQDKQRVVAAIERERLDLLERLRRRQGQIAEARDALRQGLIGTLHAPELRLHASAVIQDLRRARRLTQELAALQQRLDAAREELVEARRARRALELLRERRFEQWRREQDRREQQLLDELATNAAAKERKR